MKSKIFSFLFILLIFCSFYSCKENSSEERKKAFPQNQFDSAYELLIQSDYEKAIKSFENLTKFFPQYPEIWYNFAICLMETKSYKNAEKAFCKTISLRKNVVMYENPQIIKEDAMTSILEVFLLEGNFKRAEKQAKKCLKENDSREMKIAILATYLRLGFSSEAKEFFNKRGINIEDFANVQKQEKSYIKTASPRGNMAHFHGVQKCRRTVCQKIFRFFFCNQI